MSVIVLLVADILSSVYNPVASFMVSFGLDSVFSTLVSTVEECS